METVPWNERYLTQNTPWDLDGPAPPFTQWLKTPAAQALHGSRLAVLGCGLGHDAALFAQAGFDVTGFDIAPNAIRQATARYGSIHCRFIEADIFALPATAGTNPFDMIVEHTFFCAIDPTLRDAYVQTASKLLKPHGVLLGLFWAHQQTGGPPYKTDPEELRQRFGPYFEMTTLQPTSDSVASRQGEEWLGLFTRNHTLVKDTV